MYPIKLYFKRPANSIPIIISVAVNLFIWGWLLYYIRKQADPVFLHYTVLFGVDYTGEWYQVFTVPLGGLFVFAVNLILGWILFQKDDFAGYLLNAVSAFIQIILLATAVLLVLLNI